MHIRKTAKQQRRFTSTFSKEKYLNNTDDKPHIRIRAIVGIIVVIFR
jgi:hypothetical protein